MEHGNRWDQPDCCGGRKTESCNYSKALSPETVQGKSGPDGWLLRAIRNTWSSSSEVPTNIKDLEDHKGGAGATKGSRNRRSCVRTSAHWARQKCVHRGVKEKVDPAGTSRLVWTFNSFAEPFGGARFF